MEPKFVRVILPQSLPVLYTYAIPQGMAGLVAPGSRVEVQFGTRKIYAALIHSFCGRPDDISRVKPILSVLDDAPILEEGQLKFWEWMASYYMCTLGEVMHAALPAAFKLGSESVFRKNPEAEYEIGDLTDDEYLIVEAFEFQDELSLQDLQEIAGRKSVMGLVKSLIGKQVLYIEEQLVERYKPRSLPFVLLTPRLKSEEGQQEALNSLSRAHKQKAVLEVVLEHHFTGEPALVRAELLRRADAGPSALQALVDKGWLQVEHREVDRLDEAESGGQNNVLEPGQEVALKSIRTEFATKDVVLLHGITSSGKTHVYVELIQEYIDQGKQVLFLLPEIALTAQLIRRLRQWLGDVGIYHSKFNDAERIEIWNKVREGRYKVVVGARSALFLPFATLGLVVVDEEHDHSYKQTDPAPRYHARDSAIYLAHQHGAKVVLGSATPSFDTYHNSRTKKFGYVQMSERYGGIRPPAITIADLRSARRREEMQSALTPLLSGAIQECLDEGSQVILFQNRRGYAPYLACGSCNWIPECRNCDVSLTYHKFTNDLRCHYCGYREPMIRDCRSCGKTNMELRGMGTERIEDDLRILFPKARIGRLDLDAVRTKYGHEKIISRFEDGALDILVGTQMVTKGLDFDRVRLVGVLNADSLLYFPDFRAVERAFQVMMQVSGRAGRKEQQGKVIIQMSDVQAPIVRYLRMADGYESLYRQEMAERKEFAYPPFVRIMKIYLKHRDALVVTEGGQAMAKALRHTWGSRIIGPAKPIISRIRNLYIREITVKTEKKAEVNSAVKADILKEIDGLYQYKKFRSMRIYVDVDAD